MDNAAHLAQDISARLKSIIDCPMLAALNADFCRESEKCKVRRILFLSIFEKKVFLKRETAHRRAQGVSLF